MSSGQVFISLIRLIFINLCCLSLCASSTVELKMIPKEPIDFGNGSSTVMFEVAYNVTELATVAGISINTGSTVVADCRPGQKLLTGLNATDLPPNGCLSLKGPITVAISNGILQFNVTFNAPVDPNWSAALYNVLLAVLVRSSTLNITVGDLRKTATVTVDWSGDEPHMVFQCSIGEVLPAVNLVLTVPGSGPETVETPDTAELKLPHNSTLNGGNFLCSVEVIYPAPKNLTDSFLIEYAPVFQADPDPVECLDLSCQFTFNCSDHGVRAYPAHTLTWLQSNSTDGAIVVNGPGEYTCQATNSLGNDTVVFKVVEDWHIVAVVVVLIVYIVYIVVNIIVARSCIPMTWAWFRDLGVGGKLSAVAGGALVIHRCCGQRPSTNDPPIPLEGTGYEIPLRPTPPKQSSTTKKCAGGTGQSDNVQISMSAELNNLRFKTSSQTMDDTITAEDYMTPVSSQKKMKLIQSQYIEIGARHEEAPNSYDTLKFARDNTTDGPAIYDEVNISDDLLDQGVTKTYENVYL